MAPKKRPSKGIHKVKDGEWVQSIATYYGIHNWERIWKAQENADLVNLREDPHLIAEGDLLFIPPFEDKNESGDTENRHRFELKPSHELLRIRLLGLEGEPLKEEEYHLEIDTLPGAAIFEQKNEKTNDKGMMEERIPIGSIRGKLLFPELDQEIELRLGYLTPLDLNNENLLIRGTQERLSSLGFDPGPIDSINGPMTEGAVQAFQEFCKENKGKEDSSIIDSGPVDGMVGPKTLKALRSYYGC